MRSSLKLLLIPGSLVALSLGATGLVPLTAADAATPAYTITNLGNLGYPQLSEPAGINSAGQVTGESTTAATITITCGPPKHRKTCTEHLIHGYLYSAGTLTNLGTLGGNSSAGAAINDSGTIAGYADLSSGIEHAALFHGGTVTDLGSLSGPTGSSSATAINDLGQVAGSTTAPGSYNEAFVETNGVMTGLGLLSGGTFSAATGINASGVVVGDEDNAASDERAFVYSNGVKTDLGTLGGPNAAAGAINDNGLIVGNSQTASDADHVFSYSNGTMTDLGAYNIDTVPEAINDSGVFVGQTYGEASNGTTFTDAFIHTGGKFEDLNTLIPTGSGYVLTNAAGINSSGQIVVEGYNTSNGQYASFLLTPA
jgi:probable HAF family extracellular repeat protein